MSKKEWRKAITDLLVPECGKYYLVYDPDYLLGDESLFIQLKEKGFEILAYTGEIDFRLLYEEKIRSSTDRNGRKELIVLIHAGKESLYIPYDLEVISTPIAVDLAELFPSWTMKPSKTSRSIAWMNCMPMSMAKS